MKLALVYHQFTDRGGLEGYLREFARELGAAGHELVLVTSRIDEVARGLAAEVRLIAPPWSSGRGLARFARRSAALVPELGVELGVDAVLGFGRTWRQDVHRAGGGCHWHYSRMLPWWKRWRPKNRLELALERRLYQGGETRHFVVNSAKVRGELAEAYQVPAERVSVIHTAVDAQRWQAAADPAARAARRQALGMSEAGPELLFASLDHRRKGLGTLLEALVEVPEARLWVAGQSLKAWRGAIGRLGLESRVCEIGRAELLPWYQAADWFVHPSHYDACANTVLQSMACGLPGVISAADGAVEFVQEGVNGTVLRDPGSAEELAERLRWALGRTEAERAAMGAAARAGVVPLTWAAHVERWMEVCRAVGVWG